MREKVKKTIVDLLFYTVGCFVYSIAVTMFTEPNKLSPGGVTGVALILNQLFSLPTGLMVLIINIPLIIAGFLALGKKFIINTAVATAIMSLSLDVVKGFVKPYYTDGILASLFGGIMMGAGLSLVFLRGATTGGTDIAAKLINHKFRFVSIGRIIMFMDLAVVAISALVYKNFQSALYSIVSIYAASRVMDGLLYGTDKGKFMHIITSYPNEISKAVFAELGRGVTLVNAVGGYTGEARSLLLCAVRPSEVTRLQSIVRKTDASAFMVISDAGEILGEGFKKNE